MPLVNTAFTFLPLALAAYSAMTSFVSIIVRAALGDGFMTSVATYGLTSTSDVISVHTPGVFDIVFYTQFMVMTGQLSLNYPSFYSTFTSLFHWSFLEFADSFAGNGPNNSTDVLKYGGAGSANQIKGSSYTVSKNLNKRLELVATPVVLGQAFSTSSSWPNGPTPTTITTPPTPITTLEHRYQ